MKKMHFLLVVMFLLVSCKNNEPDNNNSTVDYRADMRSFVMGISAYAKNIKPGFVVIPQNGIELVTLDGEIDGQPAADYLSAIDGNGQEDLNYGYNNDDEATPAEDTDYLTEYLNISKDAGKTILITDYCSTHSKMDDAFAQCTTSGYISFATDHRELNNIPDYPQPIHNQNNNTITALSQVNNFLYLINPENYADKTTFINSVTATNYDLLIMDLFFTDNSAFTANEIAQLKNKANGGKRLVIAYMSIGEAENYRYYWQTDWESNKPEWLDNENPDWEGNYKVKYWNSQWQSIIYGNDNSYLKKILDAGFDGVYLDIIDTFEYYE